MIIKLDYYSPKKENIKHKEKVFFLMQEDSTKEEK